MTDRTTSTPPPSDRKTFLRPIRDALGRSASIRPTEPPPQVDESLVRLAGPDDDLGEMFTQRARAVGMTVHDNIAPGDLIERVVALLRELGATRVVTAAVPNGQALDEALRRDGMTVLDGSAPGGLDAQFDTDAGVTGVDAALAETGTLICCSSARHGRGPSLVAPIHLAVVRQSDILPDMIDYWRRLDGTAGTDLPASMVMITGPSKTADIEGELIVGVHGPGQVHILLVRDDV